MLNRGLEAAYPDGAMWRHLERSALVEISQGNSVTSALAELAENVGRVFGIADPIGIYLQDADRSSLQIVRPCLALPSTLSGPGEATALSLGGVDLKVDGYVHAPVEGFDGVSYGLVVVPDKSHQAHAKQVAIATAHIVAVALERDNFHKTLQEREMELARVQSIGKVGGVEVYFNNGFKNRRSPEYLEIHGLSSDAKNESHEDWVNRIHPEDREATVRHFLEAVAGDTVDYQSDYRIVRPSDGEVRWISVKARIERDSLNRAIRLVGAHIDVTDRMIAQNSLRESEERFRLIADSAPVPIWVTKLDRTRSFANRAYIDFLGLPYDEAVLFDWRKILHPDDGPRILAEQIKGESSLKPFSLEARYQRADGKWRWLRSISQPRWDANGAHAGFIGVAYDITAAKEALQKSEVQFERLVQAVVDYALFMISPDGIVTSWNSGAQRIKGYLPSEIIGRHFSIFYSQQDVAEGLPEKAISTAAREGRFESEGLRLRKDGTSFWAHVILDKIEAEDGSLIGFAKITRDITERKEAEANLRKAQQELLQSQKIEAIGQLTGGVAHDFNNLLMAIQGSIELAERRLPAETPAHRFLKNAHEAAQRGARLTQRMLAFARRQELNPTQFNVANQIQGLRHFLETTLGPAYRIITEFDSELMNISADANQFDLAILNLSVNARDAMPEGGAIVIRGENRLDAEEGRHVAISITDTGAGMDEATRDRALEPFFTTKGVGKGTGLGLSMVHGMIEQLGGRMMIESQLGAGTTITLLFPAATELAIVTSSERKEASLQLDRSRTVLAVDDDPLVLLNTVTMLEDIGFRVVQATSAKEALELLRRRTVDLLITDQAMPDVTGVELIQKVRELNPALPVIIATGYAELPDHAKDHRRLTKPFQQKDLEEALAAVLSEPPAAELI